MVENKKTNEWITGNINGIYTINLRYKKNLKGPYYNYTIETIANIIENKINKTHYLQKLAKKCTSIHIRKRRRTKITDSSFVLNFYPEKDNKFWMWNIGKSRSSRPSKSTLYIFYDDNGTKKLNDRKLCSDKNCFLEIIYLNTFILVEKWLHDFGLKISSCFWHEKMAIQINNFLDQKYEVIFKKPKK